jgi:hypothetical protein
VVRGGGPVLRFKPLNAMQPLTQSANQWLPLLGTTSVIAVVIAVAKSFEWLDGMVSDRGREALTHWLSNAPDDAKIDSWATIFPKLIDRVFGTRAWSLKFLFRSCVASVIAVTTVTILFYVVVESHRGQTTFGIYLFGGLILGTIANCFPDYLSLLVTRTIVRLLEKNPMIVRTGILLIVDTLLTAIVAEVAIYCLLVLIVGAIGLIAKHSLALLLGFLTPMMFYKFMLIPFHRAFYTNLFCIFVYSAFFTSVWLWLYVISIGVIRIAHRVRFLWVRLLPFLDIEKKPIVAIGRVAGLIAGAVYTVLLGTAWLVRYWH